MSTVMKLSPSHHNTDACPRCSAPVVDLLRELGPSLFGLSQSFILYFRQILSTDFMNRFYLDVTTGGPKPRRNVQIESTGVDALLLLYIIIN